MSNSIKLLLAGNVEEDSMITIEGWVKTRRDSKAGISFLQVHDGSCFDAIQAVIPSDLANYETEVLKLTAGCSVSVTGKLVRSQGKGQSFEIQATEVSVVGWVDNPETYPIQAKRHTLEYLREVSHLRVRTNTIGAVTRVRHAISQSIHQFFNEEGYFWVHTPIITSNDCEGAGDLFRVSTLDLLNVPKNEQGKPDFSKDFFGRETFLTVSGQLNVEAYCMAMSKVYTFGPTFRAENSHTSRHLAEFWMVEPELAFADLNDIIGLAEKMLKRLVRDVLQKCEDDINFFNQFIDKSCLGRLQALEKSAFEVMSYTDAIAKLREAKRTFEFPVEWGVDLQSEHERYLSEELCRCPVVITDYPKDIKGFYMRLNEDEKTVAAMDVLAPGIGEIIGGSQREERLTVLDRRMDECGVEKEMYEWYRDLRRYGTVPHAGFGLGLERMISYVTGLANVRDVIPYPRVPGNASY